MKLKNIKKFTFIISLLLLFSLSISIVNAQEENQITQVQCTLNLPILGIENHQWIEDTYSTSNDEEIAYAACMQAFNLSGNKTCFLDACHKYYTTENGWSPGTGAYSFLVSSASIGHSHGYGAEGCTDGNDDFIFGYNADAHSRLSHCMYPTAPGKIDMYYSGVWQGCHDEGMGSFSCEEVTTPQNFCSDGIVAGIEECDDGNLNDGDGCSSRCFIEEEQEEATEGDNAGSGTVEPGIGDSPVIEYLWILPDDDNTTPETQLEIVPGEERNDIYACMLVSDEQGKETIRDVFVDVYHPDGSKKYQMHATWLNESNNNDTVEIENCKLLALNNGLITSEELEDINYWTIAQPRWKMYKVYLPMYYHQPSGQYEARGYATDSTSRLSDPYSRFFEWVAGTYLELDFDFVDFGTLQPGFWQYLDGDLDMSTPDAPTLKNEGNTEVQVGLKISEFEGKEFGKKIDLFDAQLRSMADNYLDIPGQHLEFYAGQRVDFSYPISLCRQEKLDFSIHATDGLVPDSYSGEITIYSTPVLVSSPVPDMEYPVPKENGESCTLNSECKIGTCTEKICGFASGADCTEDSECVNGFCNEFNLCD